jgi:hypothetical protein
VPEHRQDVAGELIITRVAANSSPGARKTPERDVSRSNREPLPRQLVSAAIK